MSPVKRPFDPGSKKPVASGPERAPTPGVIGRWTDLCFPAAKRHSEAGMSELIKEAEDEARDDNDESSAVAWAEGYEFPDQYVDSDVKLLRASALDFEVMVRRRQSQLAHDRLSVERVSRLRPDNPEINLMIDLAGGMRVHLPDDFKPNGDSPRTPLRDNYVAVSTAVNKMLAGLIEQKLAFLLPLGMAQEHVKNLHLCKAHWTTKKGKPSGRPLGDMSRVDGMAINTDSTSAAATAYYGKIRHPTIEDIAVMIHDFWEKAVLEDPSLRWADLRIWKMDLRGAYTLLFFRPEDVGLFGMLLTGDRVYLQIAGIFGWSGTPAAFQVVTRAISWELRHALKSWTLMYVDDIIGVGFEKDIEQDLATARRICTDLLGSTAVADDKTESGVCVDVIGYTVNLPERRILIARKNFLKALHGYVSTDVSQRVNLRTLQRLASYSSRYGMICRVMRPFSGALYRDTWGRTDRHALFWLSPEAIIAVQCWRVMLCLVRFRETEFTRSIESFALATPVLVAEFDSSLSGAGVIWFARNNGAEEVLGVSAIDLTFLGFGIDSSNQNLSEFTGAIIAVIGQVMLGWSGRSLALRGDSITALTWAITERPRGTRVTNAAMIWTLLCIAADVHVKEVTHIAGTDNGRCDRLSRRVSSATMSVAEEAAEMGVLGGTVVEVNGNESVMAILRLCDPRTELNSESQFIDFWTSARSAIDAFISQHQIRPVQREIVDRSDRI